jgi:hypothetical protein
MIFQLFGAIFTTRFRKILRRGNKNLLSLLSCGALSSHEETRTTIKDFAEKYVPNFLE